MKAARHLSRLRRGLFGSHLFGAHLFWVHLYWGVRTTGPVARFEAEGTAHDRQRKPYRAWNLPLGDGIAITGDDRSILPTPQCQAGESSSPAHWVPSDHALRECLALQAEAPPISLVARLFGVDPLSRDGRRSYSGALAEIALADSLAALGEEWTVVHSVTVGGDIAAGHHPLVLDHLVIGPAGIFSITIHSHAGQAVWVGERTFMVDDERLGHLTDAERAASAASRLLTAALAAAGTAADVVVTPCIVVDSPSTLQIRQRPDRIQTSTARDFTAWLAALPRVISPTVVNALSGVSLQASTWSVSAAVHPLDAQQRRDDFDQLCLRIDSARVRRLVWTGLGVILSYSLVISSATGFTLFAAPHL